MVDGALLNYLSPSCLMCIIGVLMRLLLCIVLQNVIHCTFLKNNLSSGDAEPVKMFERTANLVNNQIINYRCDPSEKWLVLIGIAPGSPEVCTMDSVVHLNEAI